MAPKRQKQAAAARQQLQKQNRPAERLKEAELAFQRGDLAAAAKLAMAALPAAAADPPTQQKIQNLLAEIYLRQLEQITDVGARVDLLNGAVKKAPGQPRLHYQRALALWPLGAIRAALSDLELVAGSEPSSPGLHFLLQLGRLAYGSQWQSAGLTPAATNTLLLLRDYRDGFEASQLLFAYAGKPLIGDEAIWTQLLAMQADSKMTPTTLHLTGAHATPVMRYYQGVTAMRTGDEAAAETAWMAAAHHLSTPWLRANLDAILRNRTTVLAQAGQWQAVVDLYAAMPRRSGDSEPDAALSEVVGLAYFNLGFAAAQAGQWSNAVVHFRAADNLIKSRQLSQNLALAEEAMEDWANAAEAWRETLRRRPRKQDHPDALNDNQVATLWLRAAHCYQRADLVTESITCLKSAIKYAPDLLALRIGLVDLLIDDDRLEAAQNELERILDEHADHVPALVRMGTLLMDQWGRDALPLWRKVLALEPENADARHAMVQIYLERGTNPAEYEVHYHSRLTPAKKIALLEKGLSEIPNAPELLLALGIGYLEDNQQGKARRNLELAAHYAAGNLAILDGVLHELLHVNGDDSVRALLPQVRAIPGLRPRFWLDQANRVFACELGEQRAASFLDEAVAMSAKLRGEDSPATMLLSAFDICYGHGAEQLASQYEQVLRSQWATSGALEYIDALQAVDPNSRKNSRALKLLDRAIEQAGKAGEPGIADMARELMGYIKRPPMPGPFDMDINRLMDIFANMDKEDFDAAFRRHL